MYICNICLFTNDIVNTRFADFKTFVCGFCCHLFSCVWRIGSLNSLIVLEVIQLSSIYTGQFLMRIELMRTLWDTSVLSLMQRGCTESGILKWKMKITTKNWKVMWNLSFCQAAASLPTSQISILSFPNVEWQNLEHSPMLPLKCVSTLLSQGL